MKFYRNLSHPVLENYLIKSEPVLIIFGVKRYLVNFTL